MRFEDERYVRVYTRDTTTILLLSWEARALLWEIFRKVDRAGLMDLGDEPVEGVAANVRIPIDVVARALPELLRRGVVELHRGMLVCPRFVEAQECAASEPARARAYRERARDLARANASGVTSRDAHVTDRDASSRNVTSPSQPPCYTVTPSVPSVPGEVHSQASAPPAAAEPIKPKRPRGTRLPEDWTPSPELAAKLRRELRVDPLASLRSFRNYWVNATRNAVKPRWDLAFENWVERDARDGKLPSLPVEETLPIFQLPDRDKYIPKPDEALDLEGFMRTGELP